MLAIDGLNVTGTERTRIGKGEHLLQRLNLRNDLLSIQLGLLQLLHLRCAFASRYSVLLARGEILVVNNRSATKSDNFNAIGLC